MIFWNGVSSDDVDVIVQFYPKRKVPQKRIEKVSVPGRNGDLIYFDDSYENYEQEYDIALSADLFDLQKSARKAANWLLAPRGYCKLEDTYEPDIYRYAYFAGPIEIENFLNQVGTTTITFNCKPQRYLRIGDNPVSMTNGQSITNFTAMDAKPLIQISGTGAGVLIISGREITISSLSDLMIDCETMNAYWGTTNLNNTITCTEFPKLVPGSNTISWTGDIDTVTIFPRWWTL